MTKKEDSYLVADITKLLEDTVESLKLTSKDKSVKYEHVAAAMVEPLKAMLSKPAVTTSLKLQVEKLRESNVELNEKFLKSLNAKDEIARQLDTALEGNKNLYEACKKKEEQVDKLLDALLKVIK